MNLNLGSLVKNEISRKFSIDQVFAGQPFVYLCAGGFERRVTEMSRALSINSCSPEYALIYEYSTFRSSNKPNLDFLVETLLTVSKNVPQRIHVEISDLLVTRSKIQSALSNIDQTRVKTVFVDITGMTNFLILLSLKMVEKCLPGKHVQILYTEATEYYPTPNEKDTILRLLSSGRDENIVSLGSLLQATGARETLILSDFKGRFREDLPTALIFFVGYEPSRALGLLDTYRPNLVIPLYGESPHQEFKWRGDFSKELHEKFGVFDGFPSIDIGGMVDTFRVDSIKDDLVRIYSSHIATERPTDMESFVIYEHFNVAISPQNSKLQTVATYAFCLKHPDVQVVFCLPGKYNPDHYSSGAGRMWVLDLMMCVA